MKKDKIKIFKFLIFILFLVVLTFFAIKMLPIFKNLSTETGRIEFQKEIEGLGFQGVLILLGLIFIQMFVAFLPGEPIELLAGMSYGAIGGMLVIYIGVFISTFFIYFLVKKFGKDFIYTFIEKEKIEKLEQTELFTNTKRLEMLIFIVFFIPGIPKDIFVFVGGLLPINTLDFLLIATFARFPSIISSTMAGANLVNSNWKMVAIIYIITFAVSGLLLFVYNTKIKRSPKEQIQKN